MSYLSGGQKVEEEEEGGECANIRRCLLEPKYPTIDFLNCDDWANLDLVYHGSGSRSMFENISFVSGSVESKLRIAAPALALDSFIRCLEYNNFFFKKGNFKNLQKRLQQP